MTTQIIINDVERVSNTAVRLSWQAASNVQQVNIYLGSDAELSLANKQLIASTKNRVIELEQANSKRHYFVLEIDENYYVTAERVLPLEGAHNFRDIGGYVNNSGKIVKWGKLYRSDHLHNLTSHDLTYLQSANFKSIVDYRNPQEYSKQPNKLWERTISTFNLIPDASSAELAAKASNDHDKIQELIALTQNKHHGISIDGSGAIMQEQNRDFVRNPETATVYRELIDIILDTHNIPMVQHCRGGKDRTGFGIALILAILEVKYELILQDYAMTGILRHSRNMRRMEEYKKETDNPEVLAFLSSMMETRNSYLAAAFTEMNKIYGSVDGYLAKALKLTSSEKSKIQQLYLY